MKKIIFTLFATQFALSFISISPGFASSPTHCPDLKAIQTMDLKKSDFILVEQPKYWTDPNGFPHMDPGKWTSSRTNLFGTSLEWSFQLKYIEANSSPDAYKNGMAALQSIAQVEGPEKDTPFLSWSCTYSDSKGEFVAVLTHKIAWK